MATAAATTTEMIPISIHCLVSLVFIHSVFAFGILVADSILVSSRRGSLLVFCRSLKERVRIWNDDIKKSLPWSGGSYKS